MRGSRKFCLRGPTLTFLLADHQRPASETPFKWRFASGPMEAGRWKRATKGPPAKRHSNGVSLAGQWWPNTECWLVSFVVLQGIRTNNAKKPYIFVIGSGPPVSPSVSAHVYLFIHLHISIYPQLRLITKIKVHTWSKHTRKNSYETKVTTMKEMMQHY